MLLYTYYKYYIWYLLNILYILYITYNMLYILYYFIYIFSYQQCYPYYKRTTAEKLGFTWSAWIDYLRLLAYFWDKNEHFLLLWIFYLSAFFDPKNRVKVSKSKKIQFDFKEMEAFPGKNVLAIFHVFFDVEYDADEQKNE